MDGTVDRFSLSLFLRGRHNTSFFFFLTTFFNYLGACYGLGSVEKKETQKSIGFSLAFPFPPQNFRKDSRVCRAALNYD